MDPFAPASAGCGSPLVVLVRGWDGSFRRTRQATLTPSNCRDARDAPAASAMTGLPMLWSFVAPACEFGGRVSVVARQVSDELVGEEGKAVTDSVGVVQAHVFLVARLA